jgi:hypothetical protein
MDTRFPGIGAGYSPKKIRKFKKKIAIGIDFTIMFL